MSQIKINRARKLSTIGNLPNTFAAMLIYVPADNITALTSRQLASQIDTLWRACGTSKAIAAREAIENGFVWDERNNCSRDIAKRPAV